MEPAPHKLHLRRAAPPCPSFLHNRQTQRPDAQHRAGRRNGYGTGRRPGTRRTGTAGGYRRSLAALLPALVQGMVPRVGAGRPRGAGRLCGGLAGR